MIRSLLTNLTPTPAVQLLEAALFGLSNTFSSCVTCDLHPLLVGAGVTGAGHDHGDRRAVLVPHGGAGGQFATHGVQDHLVQVALQERQQHLEEMQDGLMSVWGQRREKVQ